MNTIKFCQINILVFFLLHVLLFMSCNESTKINSDLLSNAESVLEEDPDSSLLIIRSIEYHKLTKEQIALYNLLTTAAIYKTAGTQSESMILESIEYYMKHNNNERLLQSYYYIGGINFDNDDVLKAQSYYLKAIEYIENSENNLIIGKLYNNLGTIYIWQSMYDYAIPYLKSAIENSKKAGDINTLAFSLRDLGRVYTMLENFDAALDFYKQSLCIADEEIRISMLGEIGQLYIEKGEYDIAYSYLQEVLNFNEPESEKYSTHISLGSLFMYTGLLDSARYHLNKSLVSDDNRILQGAYYYLMLTEEKAGNFAEMAKLFNLFWKHYEKYEKEQYSEKVIFIDNIFQNNRLEKINADLKMDKMRQNFIQSTLIIILTFICLFFVSYSIKKHNEIKIQKKRFKEWVDKYETKEVEKKSFETLIHSSIYRKFHDKNVSWKPETEDWKSLSTLIDKTYNNFTYNIRGLYPLISDYELKISYLIKIGVSPGKIASILNSTMQGVTMTRNRLYEKITKEKGSTIKFDELILKL